MCNSINTSSYGGNIMFRISWDKGKTRFIPQRKGWFSWRYYRGHPYVSKRFGGTIIEALEIIDADEERRAKGWSTGDYIKLWFGIGCVITAVVLMFLRIKGMI